jgi:hypothetical protein
MHSQRIIQALQLEGGVIDGHAHSIGRHQEIKHLIEGGVIDGHRWARSLCSETPRGKAFATAQTENRIAES